jgi:hypothetical protein
MNPLSLKGFLGIAAAGALLFGCGIGYICLLTKGLGPDEIAGTCIGGLLLGFGVAGCSYLVHLVIAMRSLGLAPSGLLPSERVILQANGVHYKGGRAGLFANVVGGKVILTTLWFVFLSHPGQPWRYTLFVPLEEVATAESCKIAGTFAGGLRVVTAGGAQELFTFGAVRKLEADGWAAAILLARYRAFPEWGLEEEA